MLRSAITRLSVGTSEELTRKRGQLASAAPESRVPIGLGLHSSSASGLVRWLPLLLAETYLAVTVVTFAFGPWPWPTENIGSTAAYLGLNQVALAVGYMLGKPLRRRARSQPLPWRGLFRASLALNVVWMLPLYSLRTGESIRDPVRMLWVLVQGVLDPGSRYVQKLEGLSQRGASSPGLYMLCTPLLFIALPVGVYYWRRLSRGERGVLILVVGFNLATWVSMGTNKGLLDTFIVAAAAGAARFAANAWGRKREHALRYVLAGTIGIGIVVGYFLLTQFSRSSGRGGFYDRDYQMQLDEENRLIRNASDPVKAAVGHSLSYLNQGYYALAVALNEPFVPCWGVGNSTLWSDVVKRFTGFDGVQSSYPARLEARGIDMNVRWHSFYTWMASDVSFVGVPVVLLFVGWIFGLTWHDVVSRGGALSLAMQGLIVTMIVYLPMNNQVLAFTPTAFAFPVILVAWAVDRRSASVTESLRRGRGAGE